VTAAQTLEPLCAAVLRVHETTRRTQLRAVGGVDRQKVRGLQAGESVTSTQKEVVQRTPERKGATSREPFTQVDGFNSNRCRDALDKHDPCTLPCACTWGQDATIHLSRLLMYRPHPSRSARKRCSRTQAGQQCHYGVTGQTDFFHASCRFVHPDKRLPRTTRSSRGTFSFLPCIHKTVYDGINYNDSSCTWKRKGVFPRPHTSPLAKWTV